MNDELKLDRLKPSRLPDVVHFQIRTTPVSDLEATFAAPDFYAKPRAEIFDLETQLKTARDKVAHLYARWQELELLQSVPSP